MSLSFSPIALDTQLSWICQTPSQARDKDMRAVHGALAGGQVQPERVFMERVVARFKKILEQPRTALRDASFDVHKKMPKIQGESYLDMTLRAKLEPPTLALALQGAGRWAPAQPSGRRLARFLERRERHSWSRETRQGRAGSLLDDTLLLSMMRRVAPHNAADVLDFGLLHAALAWDAKAVQGFLEWGADPLRASFDVGLLASQKNMGIIPAILCRYPGDPAQTFRAGSEESDELLLGALFLVEACLPQADLLAARQLAPARGRPASKVKRAPDALALAWAAGMVHCCRHLAPTSADPGASIAWARDNPWERPTTNEHQKRALEALSAQIEARDIARFVEQPSVLNAPKSPRL
jgi:hypothetical protein